MPGHPDTLIQAIAAGLFALALLHTFTAKQFERLSHRFPRHAGLFHLLGEVEVVFGFWAVVLVLVLALLRGGSVALEYAESRHYTEPLFVFVVMVVAASRPIVHAVLAVTQLIARLAPLPTPLAAAWLGLAAVPLFGSFITEPAAMTIAAMLLAPQIFRPGQVTPERIGGHGRIHDHGQRRLPAEVGRHEHGVPVPLGGHHEHRGRGERRQRAADRDVHEQHAQGEVLEVLRDADA